MKPLIRTLMGLALFCIAPAAQAQDSGREIERWYLTYLGRAAEPAGINDWVSQLNNSRDRNQILAGFVAGEEYWIRSGNTAEGLVARLFVDTLGRNPNPNEANYWVRRAFLDNVGTVEGRRILAYDFLSHNVGAAIPAPIQPPSFAKIRIGIVGENWRGNVNESVNAEDTIIIGPNIHIDDN